MHIPNTNEAYYNKSLILINYLLYLLFLYWCMHFLYHTHTHYNIYNYTTYTNQLYNNNNNVNENQIPLMFGVKCQIIKGNQEQVENMKTSSTSLDLIVQMMLINTPKRKKCIDNLHSMNKYMIVNSLHY